ncbi:unnamed protein product [Gongylonema pulchrum]|uniref:protein-ribulosamine 3-kinase n=1 Tax=Gongylonema pulchrum TaxID=637853 RepID=A0A183DWJ2_9BILA|nr:unnamed protein product [Gongylonema pulchrum]
MEFLDMSGPSNSEQLGTDVARLHLHNKLQMEASREADSRITSTAKQLEPKTGDRELPSLWSQLERKIPEYFKDCEIFPSLLHGDLWSGNYSFSKDGPVLFDPASFYGHSEYEFGILTMFGGFSQQFHAAYHKLIPKAKGFEQRVLLYQLFHHLNHWFVFFIYS